MAKVLKLAIAGLGRMGAVHAFHAAELARQGGACEISAIADLDSERANRIAREIGTSMRVCGSIEELTPKEICDAVVIVTPTEDHRRHAERMLSAGKRVLLEKPLTGTVEADREFAEQLDRQFPDGLMLGFQRRFDEPLVYARELMHNGLVGRIFKIYSALEDSNPAPNGYKSGGILPDMSVHNVDEVLWLTGAMPDRALTIGSRLYSHALTTCAEDFDDALLCLWFGENLLAQIQVSRNHVSGYRVETVLFGEKGQIHVGRFEQRPFEVLVEAYGPRGRTESLASRVFTMRKYENLLPEFVDRFGPAYKAELAQFVECCRTGSPFPVTHRDGLRAQQVISAGMRAAVTPENGGPVAL